MGLAQGLGLSVSLSLICLFLTFPRHGQNLVFRPENPPQGWIFTPLPFTNTKRHTDMEGNKTKQNHQEEGLTSLERLKYQRQIPGHGLGTQGTPNTENIPQQTQIQFTNTLAATHIHTKNTAAQKRNTQSAQNPEPRDTRGDNRPDPEHTAQRSFSNSKCFRGRQLKANPPALGGREDARPRSSAGKKGAESICQTPEC